MSKLFSQGNANAIFLEHLTPPPHQYSWEPSPKGKGSLKNMDVKPFLGAEAPLGLAMGVNVNVTKKFLTAITCYLLLLLVF